jgi:small subunit ribosomal protein S7
MPRRRKQPKRRTVPDFRFDDVLVTEFISALMKRGKRSVAEQLFYDACNHIEKRSGDKGLDTFHKAMNNVKPVLEVRSLRNLSPRPTMRADR